MKALVVARGLAALLISLGGSGLLGGCGGPVAKQFRPQGKVAQFSDVNWQAVLDAVCTDDGYVRYDVLTSNTGGARDALYRYVGQLNAVSPQNRPELFATREDRLAYWLNAYNALCMYGVLEKGLPNNVLASGLYFLSSFPVGGDSMSLDTLEKKYVRTAGDPRVHFALNCMSKSCPPLRKEAYAGAKLDAQLDEQGKIYLSDPRGAVRDGQKVKLSEIFKFYDGEFLDAHKQRTGKSKVTLVESIEPYADANSPVRGATGHNFMKYDWTLNRGK